MEEAISLYLVADAFADQVDNVLSRGPYLWWSGPVILLGWLGFQYFRHFTGAVSSVSGPEVTPENLEPSD